MARFREVNGWRAILIFRASPLARFASVSRQADGTSIVPARVVAIPCRSQPICRSAAKAKRRDTLLTCWMSEHEPTSGRSLRTAFQKSAECEPRLSPGRPHNTIRRFSMVRYCRTDMERRFALGNRSQSSHRVPSAAGRSTTMAVIVALRPNGPTSPNWTRWTGNHCSGNRRYHVRSDDVAYDLD